MHPLRNYLFIDNLLLYAMYENFYINLNKDLNILGYSPEEIKLIHYEVSKTLNILSFDYKGRVLSEDESTKLFNLYWEYNDKVKFLK